MDQLTTFFASLETTLGIQAPYLKMAFKVTLVIVGFLIVWLILRQVLAFIEKRMQKVNLIEIQGPLFKIIRKALLYALVLLTGTYLIELFNFPLLEKIFHALFIILFAQPVKNFLIVTIRYLQARVAHKTDSKIDDILFDLLIRFSNLSSIPWRSLSPLIFWGSMWCRLLPAPGWPGWPSGLLPKIRSRI